MEHQSTPEHRPQTVITVSSASATACLGCQKPFQPRRPNQRYCSTPCRAVAFQRRRDQAQAERDAKVRLHLKEALALLEDSGP